MTTNEPEIARPVLVGDTADIYLHRTLTILRQESINPNVVMEITPGLDCRFAGIGEVVQILSRVLPESGREVWSLPEGSEVEVGEVCLRIRAPYASFGLYETARDRHARQLFGMGDRGPGMRRRGRRDPGQCIWSEANSSVGQRHNGLLGRRGAAVFRVRRCRAPAWPD